MHLKHVTSRLQLGREQILARYSKTIIYVRTKNPFFLKKIVLEDVNTGKCSTKISQEKGITKFQAKIVASWHLKEIYTISINFIEWNNMRHYKCDQSLKHSTEIQSNTVECEVGCIFLYHTEKVPFEGKTFHFKWWESFLPSQG